MEEVIDRVEDGWWNSWLYKFDCLNKLWQWLASEHLTWRGVTFGMNGTSASRSGHRCFCCRSWRRCFLFSAQLSRYSSSSLY